MRSPWQGSLVVAALVAAGCASRGAGRLVESRPAESAPAADIHVRLDPQLAARLEVWRGAHGVPGMGAAIVLDREVTVAVAGKRRVDRDGPLVESDAFHLGSDTKAMTASVVARLVDRGVLHWNETLAEALPDIERIDPAFKPVTLEMLMHHTSGLPVGDAFTPEFTQGFDEAWPIERQRAWMAERFLSRPPTTQPGSRFAYSNYGLLIVGRIVERATGKTWEDLVRQEVFEPLGMTGCGFGATATNARPEGNWAHDVKDGNYVATEEDNPPLIGPAGTVHCTLASWARFAIAHAHPESGGWIMPASMAHLHEPFAASGLPPDKDVGLGWGIARTNPPRLTHSGSNGYNDAEIVVIPKWHAAVLVTCNAGDERARAAAKEVSDRLVAELVGAEGKGPLPRRQP